MTQTEPDMKMRILYAAKKLFARQGFEGTSVRQICEEAGANVALVSYYFGGKEKVLHAIFEHFFPGRQLSEHDAYFAHPVQGLSLIVREIIRFSLVDRELSTIIQQEMVMNTPRAEVVISFVSPVWSKARNMLEQGRKEGLFHYESLDQALLFVMGATLAHKQIGCIRPLLSPQDLLADETAEHTLHFILKALGAPGSPA
ncbi:TetR family transcriptional regulator [Paenibacillus ehimensis]|uniref:TetR family transcriptional regulator n=1 Tax=Paenibacillus ehimensis TaxID=79264 RepID=A0ABT8VLP9_9BACL|nr:TetR family transcriptional regulator [Paenibacillus ehimensis]MDO3681903.1 TetR family transcriptional regulator [Paenibacillus ehimensis]MEC0213877.1 TetR family transcriptional regulator [Paenibacillus ehimensis]